MKVHFKSLEHKIALQVIILEELFLLSLSAISKVNLVSTENAEQNHGR